MAQGQYGAEQRGLFSKKKPNTHKPTLLFLLKYTVKDIFLKVDEMQPYVKEPT